jgi:hypothetical protein
VWTKSFASKIVRAFLASAAPTAAGGCRRTLQPKVCSGQTARDRWVDAPRPSKHAHAVPRLPIDLGERQASSWLRTARSHCFILLVRTCDVTINGYFENHALCPTSHSFAGVLSCRISSWVSSPPLVSPLSLWLRYCFGARFRV